MAEALRVAVILPAAGKGRRFADSGGQGRKLEQDLADRAVLLRSIELFLKRPDVVQVIVAVDPEEMDHFRSRWGDRLGLMNVELVAGGQAERWETVRNALERVEENATHVAVHDAARPVTELETIERVFEAAVHHAAVIPATPVSATLKRAEPIGAEDPDEDAADGLDAILGTAGKHVIETFRVLETVPRDGLWAIQTPQLFAADLLRRAYRQLEDEKLDGAGITDDAGLVEALGEEVVIVPGDPLNVKITTKQDLDFAAAVLAMRSGDKTAGSFDDLLGPKRKFPTWAESEDD